MRYKIAYSISCSGWVEIDEHITSEGNLGFDIVGGRCSPLQKHGVALDQPETIQEALVATVIQILAEHQRTLTQQLAQTVKREAIVTMPKGQA